MKTNCYFRLKAVSLLLLTLSFFSVFGQPTIDRFAGLGISAGYSGDGGPATSAKLSFPYHLSADANGNIYIADMNNAAIRKVNSNGVITTVAGANLGGYAGDGGPATSAKLNYPLATAVDNYGNIYIVDQANFVVRKINSSGNISTFSGSGTAGYSGDGGPAIAAKLTFPIAIAVDQAGNVYIADAEAHVIRKVNTSGIISTIAGIGISGYAGDNGPGNLAKLSYPTGVAVDNNGNLYIADRGNRIIRKVSQAGIITTFAGNGSAGSGGDGGPAELAQFGMNSPQDVAVDNTGNVYATDYQNHTIRKINTNGIITTVAGTAGVQGTSGDGGPATDAKLWFPLGIAVDACQNLYYTEPSNSIVRRIVVNPAVSFSAQPVSVNACINSSTTFFVRANNATTYQWQINTGSGWIDLADNNTYSGAFTFQLQINGVTKDLNNAQFRCLAKNFCNVSSSSSATLTIPNADATVSIKASASAICQGNSVTFQATVSNAGNSFSYQWQKNGINVGTNSSVYNDINPNTGDRISCSISIIGSCLSNQSFTSNEITLTVLPLTQASVNISTSTSTICHGAMTTFTAHVINGGPSSSFQWTKNGIPVGSNNAFYSNNVWNTNDVVQCTVTINNVCQVSSQVQSNIVKMTVTPLSTPFVNIISSAQVVCEKTAVQFTAQVSDAGSLPTFQWERNGSVVGGNSNIYIESNPTNGEMIICKVYPGDGCFTSTVAASNAISLVVHPYPVVSLNKTTTLCEGTTRTLNPGNFESYQWNNGSTESVITVNKTGTYYVAIKDSNGCAASDTTHITQMLPSPQNFLPRDTVLCNDATLTLRPLVILSNYLWNDSSQSSQLVVSKPGTYWLQANDIYGCNGTDTIVIVSKQCLKGIYIPNAFTPNGDGKNDVFKVNVYETISNFRFNIYNRWGELIFSTNDPTKGWNGSMKNTFLTTGVFVWSCQYQLRGGQTMMQTGTVTLIR